MSGASPDQPLSPQQQRLLESISMNGPLMTTEATQHQRGLLWAMLEMGLVMLDTDGSGNTAWQLTAQGTATAAQGDESP